MKLKRKDSELKQIIAQAQGAQTRLKYSKTELENLRKKIILKCQVVGPQEFDFLTCDTMTETVFSGTRIYCVMVTQEAEMNSQCHSIYSVLSSADCFQEISRMESELANLESQIQMQKESVEAKDEQMKRIRGQINQVRLSLQRCYDIRF